MINLLKTKLPESALTEMYEKILQQAMMMNKTKTGTLQIINNSTRSLEIVYSIGLSKKFVEHFQKVEANDGSVCGQSLKMVKSVYIMDLTNDKEFQPHLKFAIHDGVYSVLSTPMISAKGKVFGIVSTHFKLPRKLTKTELSRFETFCGNAADNIEEEI